MSRLRTRAFSKSVPPVSRKWLLVGIGVAVAVILLVLLFVLPKGGGYQLAYVSFCPDGNHPHIIDLGLPSGTKWACCNVGALKPEDYGDYFALASRSATVTSTATTGRRRSQTRSRTTPAASTSTQAGSARSTTAGTAGRACAP